MRKGRCWFSARKAIKIERLYAGQAVLSEITFDHTDTQKGGSFK